MATFSTVLRQLRLDAHLTQGELAQKLHMSVSSISMYEKGNRKPSLEVLECFADFFNVDVDYLLGKSPCSTYYMNPQMIRLIQDIQTHREYKILLKAVSQLSPASLQQLIDTALELARKEQTDV